MSGAQTDGWPTGRAAERPTRSNTSGKTRQRRLNAPSRQPDAASVMTDTFYLINSVIGSLFRVVDGVPYMWARNLDPPHWKLDDLEDRQ